MSNVKNEYILFLYTLYTMAEHIQVECNDVEQTEFDELVHKQVVAPQAPQTILQFKSKPPIRATVSMSTISEQLYSPVLYEIEEKEPSDRLVLYACSQSKTDYVTFCFPYLQYTEQLCHLFTLSIVVCFSTEQEALITDDTPLVWCLFEFSLEKQWCVVDGIVLSRNQYGEKREEFKKKKKSCVLDIDKTIILSFDSCSYYETKKFRTDFQIEGYMYVTNDYFRHNIMVRDGLYDLIRLLQENDITIYFLTWGDINYGRAIIRKLNELHWRNISEPRSETDQRLVVPVSHVFSTRNTEKKALPKHFKHILPFFNKDDIYYAIDDDPAAWDVEVRLFVFPISPFSPLMNDSSHLLYAANSICTRVKS